MHAVQSLQASSQRVICRARIAPHAGLKQLQKGTDILHWSGGVVLQVHISSKLPDGL